MITLTDNDLSILKNPDLWTCPFDPEDNGEFVERRYFKWSEVESFDNFVRKNGTDLGKVERFADYVRQNGINPNCMPVVIDADTKQIITGNHRQIGCRPEYLDFDGWMGDFVRCKSDFHRKRLALKLNNTEQPIQSGNDIESVTDYIISNLDQFGSENEIKDEIKYQSNFCLTKAEQTVVFNKVSSHIDNNGVKGIERSRYTTHTADTFQDYCARSSYSYVDRVVNSFSLKSAHMFFNHSSGTTAWSIISKATEVDLDGVLNIASSTSLPSGKQTLQDKRENSLIFFKNIGSRLDKLFMYKISNNCYPWEHINCQHAWLAQDHNTEDVKGGQFIPFKL